MRRFLGLLFVLLIAFVFVGCTPKEQIKLEIKEEDKAIEIAVGESKTVTVEVTEGYQLEWSSKSNDIATVANGTITGVSEGTTEVVVKVKDKDVSATISVTVVKPNPTEVVITGDTTVIVGSAIKLSATVQPSAADQTITWESSDETIATVDSQGNVTGLKPGQVTITAKSVLENVKKSVTIEVVRPQPTKVTITGDTKVIIGSSINLQATVEPDIAEQTITWESSDPTIASVNQEGKVTGLSVGKVTITAKSVSENVKATIEIEVVLPDPTNVTIIGPNETRVGEQIQLMAVIAPALANQQVIWSVDNESLATIDENGKLTALAKGQVKVIARSKVKEEVFAEYTITIILVEPTSITISGSNEIYLGQVQTVQYTATVLPAGVSQSVIWSVDNESIATINENGLLTPLAVGTVKIIARSAVKEEVYAEYTLVIKEFLPTGISITGKSKVLIGLTEQYVATVLPEGISQNVIWSVDNETLATINANGVLTPLAEGTIIITATSALLNTVQATIEVQIVDSPEAVKLLQIAQGYTAYFPGGDVVAFIENHGFSGYTLEFGDKQLLFYGEKAFISLRAMQQGEGILPWQAVQPHTEGPVPFSNGGVKKSGVVGPVSNDLNGGTGVIYYNGNDSKVIVDSKHLYGYQGNAWGHGSYGVILVNNEGTIVTNFAGATLEAGVEIEIPSGYYLITMYQAERQVLAGIGVTDNEVRRNYSFALNPNFQVGKTIKITYHNQE